MSIVKRILVNKLNDR